MNYKLKVANYIVELSLLW